MGVWRPMSIANEPETRLYRWQRLRVWFDGEKDSSIHFVGDAWDGGRVCSPVQRYDARRKAGTTRSGRVYRLVGPTGSLSPDAQYVFNIWCKNNKVLCVEPVKRMPRKICSTNA